MRRLDRDIRFDYTVLLDLTEDNYRSLSCLLTEVS